jgi:hypothetical protein
MSDERQWFVVRAVGQHGTLWISRFIDPECRWLTTRDAAAMFETREQAQTAVNELARVLKDYGDWTFHVEPN